MNAATFFVLFATTARAVVVLADFSPFWQVKGFATNDSEYSPRFCAEACHPLERFELAKIAYQAFPDQFIASITQFQLSCDDLISLREMVVRRDVS